MLETLKTSHFACSTEYQLVCQQVSEFRKEKRFPPSLLGHRGFPGSLPKRDKGEGLRQGIPSSLRSGTGGPPGSFTGSLPASSQPISCNGMSPGTRGFPPPQRFGHPWIPPLPRPLDSPSRSSEFFPVTSQGLPACTGSARRPRGPLMGLLPAPPERREPAGLPAETAAPHAGPARQNREAARRPGPGAAGGPDPRPTLKRSS